MSYKRGDIIIVKFPFILNAGTEHHKGRPALVISDHKITKRYKDIILSAITSQVPSEIMEWEIVLEPEEANGLIKKSLLRLDFIMTIPEELISRKIGTLSKDILQLADQKLKVILGIQS